MITYIVPGADPAWNLALEEYCLKQIDTDETIVLLWQNDNTIVVGLHQNAELEINRKAVQENGVQVVRRETGGGTVYHDLGNLNFSLIQTVSGDRMRISFDDLLEPVVRTLCEMGLSAEISGRNDIVIDERKVSGNAQSFYHQRNLCHGTLLFDSDLTFLAKVLNVREEKLKNKGVASVRARVANIADCLREKGQPVPDMKTFIETIYAGLTRSQDVRELKLSDEALEEISRLAEEKYRSDAWTWGKDPGYEVTRRMRYPFGEVEIALKLRKGKVEDLQIYGDFFGRKDIEELEACIRGRSLTELEEALPDTIDDFISGMNKEEFLKLIRGEEK